MILGSELIKFNIGKGNISISDYSDDRLNPNSYNLRLDRHILKVKPNAHSGIYRTDYIDLKIKQEVEPLTISNEGLILYPGELYLANTIEETETKTFVPCIEGRSSLARVGLSVHVTAGFGDVGFKGKWTLEITVVKPVRVYYGIDICQIYYFDIKGLYKKYEGKYQNNKGVMASLIEKDFDGKQ
jgi:dCTP deaminase